MTTQSAFVVAHNIIETLTSQCLYLTMGDEIQKSQANKVMGFPFLYFFTVKLKINPISFKFFPLFCLFGH